MTPTNVDAALASTPIAQNDAVKPMLAIVDASPAFIKLTAKTLPKMTAVTLPPIRIFVDGVLPDT